MKIQTNHITLHYLDHNPDSNAPLLVLMHGLSANAHCFDGLVAAGLTASFRVVSVDLRGRGQSDKPATGYSMADHSADIIGLLDALGAEQVILGGHSFGGLLTMYTAVHYPTRVSKLIIMDAAGSLHPNVRELIKPSLARLEKTLPSWEAYRDAMKAQPFLHGLWDDALEAYYRADVEVRDDGTAVPRSDPHAIWSAADLAIEEPWAEHLAQIHQPALLIRAPENYGPAPILPPEQAQETVNALANCTYVEVQGNHMTMLFGERATAVVEAIETFVNGQ
ncbi:MAG: alpha/beta hydrolase [Anaerolineales bacterium]|nr:alpha/beta hydrolase [Anaerolineales bacterium]